MNLQRAVLSEKAHHERLHAICFHLRSIMSCQHFRNGGQMSGCQGSGMGGEGTGGRWVWLQKDNRSNPCDAGSAEVWTVVMEAQTYPGNKIVQLVAASVTTARKEPKCPLMDKWISTMRSIHTTEYRSVLRRTKKILTHAMIRMNLENMTLSEISQSQKGKYPE